MGEGQRITDEWSDRYIVHLQSEGHRSLWAVGMSQHNCDPNWEKARAKHQGARATFPGELRKEHAQEWPQSVCLALPAAASHETDGTWPGSWRKGTNQSSVQLWCTPPGGIAHTAFSGMLQSTVLFPQPTGKILPGVGVALHWGSHPTTAWATPCSKGTSLGAWKNGMWPLTAHLPPPCVCLCAYGFILRNVWGVTAKQESAPEISRTPLGPCVQCCTLPPPRPVPALATRWCTGHNAEPALSPPLHHHAGPTVAIRSTCCCPLWGLGHMHDDVSPPV